MTENVETNYIWKRTPAHKCDKLSESEVNEGKSIVKCILIIVSCQVSVKMGHV